MKQFEIKIHNDSQTISSQKINLKNNQVNIIKAMSKVNYELIDLANGFAPDHIITKREKDDLHILFEDEDNSEIILEDFYNTEQSCLIGMSELGNYHYYTPDSGDVEDYVTLLTASNQISGHALGSREMTSAWWAATPSYKPSYDVSNNTNYVINNGKELIVVDSLAEVEQTEPVSTSNHNTVDHSTDNHDTASSDMMPSNVAVPDTAYDNSTYSTANNKTAYTETAEPIEQPTEEPQVASTSTTNWTPWAVGIASVAGLALALGGSSKAGNTKSKNTATNAQNSDSDNSSDNTTKTDSTDLDNSPDNLKALIGDDQDNTLVGSQEDEVITGGKGSDSLTGGGGKDVFNYSDLSLSDLLDSSMDVDTITDFANDDKIQIDSDILQNYNPSKDIFDYITYDNNTGALSVDVDASGTASAVHFASIDNGMSLTHENFVII